MMTTETDGDRMEWLTVVPSAARVPCAKDLLVTAMGCIDAYVDAEARPLRQSPCYHCEVGRARRVALAGGHEEPAPQRGGRRRRPGRKPPDVWAREKKIHLLETVQELRPATTAADLRKWIATRRWPDYVWFRRELAARLGVELTAVAWR